MKISYDYEEMLQELREDIEDGMLNSDSFIQIERGEERLGYSPIIDWYYDQVTMISMCNPEIDDSSDEKKEKVKIWKDYTERAPYLKLCRLSDVLEEMEEMNRIF